MIVVFDLAADCLTCGGPLRGIKISNITRVNLSNLHSSFSIGTREPCEKCGATEWPDQASARLDEESDAKVTAARDKIRSRRKKAAV